MGKRSRRRAREDRQGWSAGGGTPPFEGGSAYSHGADFDADAAISAAATRWLAGDYVQHDLAITALTSAWLRGPKVPALLADRLLSALQVAWTGGWQPADVARVVARRLEADHGRLAVLVIAADAERYRGSAFANARWLQQLDELGADVWWKDGEQMLNRWGEREHLPVEERVRVAVGLLGLLWALRRQPILMPPPDTWGPGQGGQRTAKARGVDPKVLHRVRSLLAKAESTTFADEAESCTAKAQQLMTRHAIDRAMVAEAGGATGADQPGGRRLGVEDPYASPKSILLAQVAAANRCEAIWSKDAGFSTVFGFEDDLDTVEVLYTSLLVQATHAMLLAGTTGPGAAQARSKSFRQSFLVGFAARIGERLREAANAAVEEAVLDHGDRLLPVLGARIDAVEEACAEAFPHTTSRSTRISDGRGWAAGRTAADLASLSCGPAVEPARSA